MDVTDPIDLLADLVRIDSVNPDLVPGGAGEARIADFCADWLARHGFEVHRLEARPGRPSVVGVRRGTGGGRTLMLNGHLDTVGAGTAVAPLDPVVRDGKLFGRGALDMKGGVAAMMVAAARQGPLRGDVVVACVADEEHGSTGTAEVLTRFTADAAVVTEPSGLDITLAHKGFAWFDVVVEGRAAHGSLANEGIDAIAKAGHFLVALDGWVPPTTHPLLGPGTVHASLISGGQEASTYPAECRVTVERRTVPGETGAAVEAELRATLDALSLRVKDFRYRLEPGLVREPFEADRDHPVVRTVARHLEAATGRAATVRAEPFWTDCALLAGAGIPCLLFGADGRGAHAEPEWTDVASVRRVADVLTAVVADFCG